jgi:hypothetical protein
MSPSRFPEPNPANDNDQVSQIYLVTVAAGSCIYYLSQTSHIDQEESFFTANRSTLTTITRPIIPSSRWSDHPSSANGSIKAICKLRFILSLCDFTLTGTNRHRENTERLPSRLELFFDLVFVAIANQMSHAIAEDATGVGIIKFILIF